MRKFFLEWAMENEIQRSANTIITVVEVNGIPIMGFVPNKVLNCFRIRLIAKENK